MALNTQQRRLREVELADGWTGDEANFAYMCKRAPNRIGIISEGDSWFAYPGNLSPRTLHNIVDHIVAHLAERDYINLLRLSTNGHTAKEMVSDEQKDLLESVLEKNGKHIRLILFSGGGNDILEKSALLKILNEYQEGFRAGDCINAAELQKKFDEIAQAYKTLCGLCEKHAPSAKIITHVYDVPKPMNKPFRALWITKGPWLWCAVKKRNIRDENLQLAITRTLLNRFQQEIVSIAKASKGRILVAKTQGTLRPGCKDDWRDEIHPTGNGFLRIAKIVYRRMRKAENSLPIWRNS